MPKDKEEKEKKDKKAKKSERSSKGKERSSRSKERTVSEKDKKSEAARSEKESKRSRKSDSQSRKSKKSPSPSPSNLDRLNREDIDQGLPLNAGFGVSTKDFFNTFNPQGAEKRTCTLHGKPLLYFCDSCEELLCYDCTVMGPHNTQLHRICSLDEAFRYRFEMINKNIH